MLAESIRNSPGASQSRCNCSGEAQRRRAVELVSRLHAVEVLIRHDQWSYRSLETQLGCLSDRDENVRWLATYSLAELAPESLKAATALANAARDPILKVHPGAVYALGAIGPCAKQAAASLHRLADDATQPELQSAILYALQQIEQ
ncbi:MAG: hypothetical protein DWH84_06250 [Planctomycetota bacterium]|nr:HEAT repeat domain-containing protein [Planctomycetales bacterium]RLS43148.1 MAG: hypothetical protein DWH84_06250 [Planctomycetota bacterium]